MSISKIFFNFISVCLIILSILSINKFTYFVSDFLFSPEAVVPKSISPYVKSYSLSFTKNANEFTPYSKNDLRDILFTAINRGYDKFTLYCPDEYSMCLDDFEELCSDANTLTHINNFVHPFNSFTKVTSSMNELGEINVIINYLYNEADIKKIDFAVDDLISELTSNLNTDRDNILAIHDYIINNTIYDVNVNNENTSPYQSSTAYGPLFEGFAICNGYTDLMAIFLNKLNIKNIKVATTPDEISYSTTGHIWNAVFIENTWLHIDLTWNDPISSDGTNYLFHDYFLISSSDLEELNSSEDTYLEEHNFNSYVYYELKN